MADQPLDGGDQRVLILAPSGRDAHLAEAALSREDIRCHICADLAELRREIGKGAGAVLVAGEALPREASVEPDDWIGPEPPWSQLPLIVLGGRASSRETSAIMRRLERYKNVTFLRRPVPKVTLISITRAALESRRRQYMVRDLLTERERAAEAALERETRLRLALEGGGMGAWDYDVLTGTAIWDARQYEICGFKPGDPAAPLGDRYLKLVHKDDREALRRKVDALFAGAENDFRHEYRIVRPDGQVRWLAGRGRTIRDQAGRPVRVVGVDHDVTERREAEDRQQVLVAELHHRVKNVLSTVQAIMMQSVRGAATAEDFAERFSGRLTALARGHDVVLRARWQPTSLAELLRQAVEPYGDPARISLDCADIWLRPKAALAFNMIVHELATNAAKYGALSVADGTVDIDCQRDERDSKMAVFRWTERDGPAVRPPARQGFGSTLIERSARYELGGDARIDYAESGVACIIRFAAADLSAGDP